MLMSVSLVSFPYVISLISGCKDSELKTDGKIIFLLFYTLELPKRIYISCSFSASLAHRQWLEESLENTLERLLFYKKKRHNAESAKYLADFCAKSILFKHYFVILQR